MYGLVNKSFQDMVLQGYGAEAWNQIRDHAGINDDLFFSTQGYPDDITYSLVGSATKILNIPAQELLYNFGKFWVLHTARESYDYLMHTGGGSVAEFLQHLPSLHNRIKLLFPELQPPVFATSLLGPTKMEVHYSSHRPGLTDFVSGLLAGIGEYFQTPLRISLSSPKTDDSGSDIFLVEW
jgi:hypothetical protein